MKIAIYETTEVSDEQRASIAAVLGKKTVTRDEMKEFIWLHGSSWAHMLGSGEVVSTYTPGDEDDSLLDLL